MTGIVRRGRSMFEPLNLFSELENWGGIFSSAVPESKNSTPMDVVEDETSYCVTADVPGFERKNIKISLDDNILTIEGEKTEEKKEKNYIRKERYNSKFAKTIMLYDDIDYDEINAELKNGILTLTLPKKEETKKKITKIEVK